MTLTACTIDQLKIDDERAFAAIAHYAALKDVLRRAKYKFRILNGANAGRWDRALFLNLTFWGGGDGDVLVGKSLPADVVAHAAWHHLAARALKSTSADAMFFGEAIASAYDVYLIGRLLARATKSSFLESQVSAMADATSAAGLSARGFAKLLDGVAADPDRAFEDLRSLLFNASTSLLAATSPAAALTALARFESHRFSSLLHHYELSTWSLYVRAYAPNLLAPVSAIRTLDRQLRKQPSSMEYLVETWIHA